MRALSKCGMLMYMKKIATVGLLLIILLGGVWYGFLQIRQGLAPVTMEQEPAVIFSTSTESTPSGSLVGQDTLENLFALGKTLECTFRTNDAGIVTEGTAFFDNGKLRIDTMFTVASNSVETANMIVNEGSMYSWSSTSDGSYAIKMPLSAPVAPTQAGTKSVSLQNRVQYDCKPWRVDGSVFVPPIDLSFIDMGDLMKGVPAEMP